MPAPSPVRKDHRQYQPPLPGTNVPPAPPRSAPGGGQDWRLDEKTRRAGRQGVAAARAALARAAFAGTGGPENGRRADAA